MPIQVTTTARGPQTNAAPPYSNPSGLVIVPIFAAPNNVFGGGLSEPLNIEIAQTSYELVLIEQGRREELEFYRDAQKRGTWGQIVAGWLWDTAQNPAAEKYFPAALKRWVDQTVEEGRKLDAKWAGVQVKTRAQWLADP